jgi:hypothetical protein
MLRSKLTRFFAFGYNPIAVVMGGEGGCWTAGGHF